MPAAAVPAWTANWPCPALQAPPQARRRSFMGPFPLLVRHEARASVLSFPTLGNVCVPRRYIASADIDAAYIIIIIILTRQHL